MITYNRLFNIFDTNLVIGVIGVLQNAKYNLRSQGCGTIAEKAYSMYAQKIGKKLASSLKMFSQFRSEER